MKTFLRSLVLFALIAFGYTKSDAQCTVSDIIVQNITALGSTDTSCSVKFDVTFNIEDNAGNKFIFIHAWLQSDYPNYFNCVNGQTTASGSIAAPKASDLIKSFINIGINNVGVPTALTSYPPDGSVPMATMDSIGKIVLPDGSANITLYGVVATSPVACTTPVVVVADLWSSQSATAQRAHCVNCGIRSSAGYLNVLGFVNCTNLTYLGSINNLTNIPISGYYRVYADVNGDGYLTPHTDTLIQGNTLFTVAPNGTTGISGSIPSANFNQDVFIVVTQTTGAATEASRVFLFVSSQCAALPVTFSSFTANRTSRTNVSLKWETSTEINNSGFTIEKNSGNNVWISAGFVATQAPGGSSSTSLYYSFNDINTSKGITQYRIKQTDLDSKIAYSEIRTVRGDGQRGNTIIYPNPSNDGRINVVFDEQTGVRDVILSDMNGRIMKQWNGISDNTLRIDNLETGMYLLRITHRKTREESLEKIMISRY
jgi:hypothetical protein